MGFIIGFSYEVELVGWQGHTLVILEHGSKSCDEISNYLIAKALAFRYGVTFSELRGFPKMVMEIDCLDVVNL
jgi:hypothetical protein